MTTLYDQLPSGLKTEDRANVNVMMNNRTFTGSELRTLYFEEYVFEETGIFKKPFVDWLWDRGVKEYLANKRNEEIAKSK